MNHSKNIFSIKLPGNHIAKDSILTVFFMALATVIAYWFFRIVPDHSANISLAYITALVLTARYTSGYLYGIIASLFGVVCVNFFFTFPFFILDFTLTDYPVTFLFMLSISIIISTMTTRMKEQADAILEREKLLMDAEKEKMRANLLRSVSHDIRTPLTGIMGNSSTYIDNYSSLNDAEKLEIVSHIRDDSNWLLNMVENLLSVTRIQPSSMKITTSLESVEEVVSEAIIRLQKRLPDAQIKVQVPEEFLMIPMDAMLIEQVIINLLQNALVHSGSKLPVELNVVHSACDVSFCIKDYGTGIAPEKLTTLFDGSAYNPQNTSDGHKGMGIGLSICKTIITAHNGSIGVANLENGCQFIFTLPKEDKQ